MEELGRNTVVHHRRWLTSLCHPNRQYLCRILQQHSGVCSFSAGRRFRPVTWEYLWVGQLVHGTAIIQLSSVPFPWFIPLTNQFALPCILPQTTTVLMQSTVADSVLIYRCYVIYLRNIWIIVLPTVLWIVDTACAIRIVQLQSLIITPDTINSETLIPWLSAFWVITVSQNIITTGKHIP